MGPGLGNSFNEKFSVTLFFLTLVKEGKRAASDTTQKWKSVFSYRFCSMLSLSELDASRVEMFEEGSTLNFSLELKFTF